MGYTITIGERKVYDDGSVGAWGAESKDAPVEGSTVYDGINVRCPSYSTWGKFISDVDLREWWERVCNEYPTVSPITIHDFMAVNAALFKYRRRYPDLAPLPAPVAKSGLSDPSIKAYHINRLDWLKYWIGWALDNCKHPVISIG